MTSPIAVDLRLPRSTRVTRVSRSSETDGLPIAGGVQLISSRGYFQEGVAYGYRLELSSPPMRGDYVGVRASVHHVESSLPFTERFLLG